MGTKNNNKKISLGEKKEDKSERVGEREEYSYDLRGKKNVCLRDSV